ncbi:MAG: DUF523 domain-containing protein [bacterium]|nr:DUF523 domain-containing protein [bacterium]
MKLISACLLGVKCRYDGASKPCEKALEAFNKNKKDFVLVCPEQLGGLPTPRVPAEIQNSTGEDVSENFIKGAFEALKIARLYGAKEFIGKSKSPSCGCDLIHNGSFSDTLKQGNGITSALLKQNGLKVISELDL